MVLLASVHSHKHQFLGWAYLWGGVHYSPW